MRIWEKVKRRAIRLFVRRRYGNKVFFSDPQGPIEKLCWGRFTVRGKDHAGGDLPAGAGADIRIIGDEVTSWLERTGHSLTPDMITEVFGREIEVLIIGTGINGKIDFLPELCVQVKSHGISEVWLEKTPEACRKFNEFFRTGKRVALLAHGTC